MSPFLGFDAKSRGDAERHIIACDALTAILQADPRVEDLYQEWRRKTGLAALIEQLKRAPDDATKRDIEAELLLVFYGAGVAMTSMVLPSFVSKELRLPYPWLAVQLFAIYLPRIMNEATSRDTFGSAVGVMVPPGTPRGRRPKNSGESIRRGVEWYYRVHVQEPPEKVPSLARAYGRELVDGHPRSRGWSDETDGVSAVKAGIATAKRLLDRAEYIYTQPAK